MKKTILLSVGVISAIIIGAIVWIAADYFIKSEIEDQNTLEYIEKKYGMEAVIVSETPASFSDWHTYEMAFKEQEDVVFTVTEHVENYATIYRDDYEAVLKLHELREKMEELMPEIEAIGFTKQSSRELADHVITSEKAGTAVRWLNLETEDSYETIERPEVQKMKELLDLQREHELDIQKIIIDSKQEEEFVNLDLRIMGDVESVEELEEFVVVKDLRLAGKRFEDKWSDAAAQAETERFRFHNEHHDSWAGCKQVNDDGDCINVFAYITFSPGELSRQNPYLEEDWNAIFAFFDNIEPKMMEVELMMVDPEREGEPVRFSLHKRKNYESTEALIEALVKD